MYRTFKILTVLILAIILFYFSFTNISTIIGVDESIWVMRGINFTNGFTSGDWQRTYQSQVPERTHPGVTLMYNQMGGLVLKRVFGEFIKSTTDFLTLYSYMKIVNIFISLVLILFSFLFFALICKKYSQIDPLLIIIFGLVFLHEPFFLSNLKRLHLDVLLASYTIISLVFFLYWLLSKQKKNLILYLTTIALTILTKITGIILIPYTLGYYFLHSFYDSNKIRLKTYQLVPPVLIKILKLSLFSLLIISIISFVLWPSMWVKPIFSVKGMFGSIFYNVITPHDATLKYTPDYTYYFGSIIKFSTPYFQLLALGSALFFILNLKHFFQKNIVPFNVFFLYAFFFGFIMTIGAKKGHRYLMPTIVALMFSGSYLISLFVTKINENKNKSKNFIILAVVVVLSISTIYQAFRNNPYFVFYYSPLFNHHTIINSGVGQGEGLKLAADYLNSKESKRNIIVAPWYDAQYSPYANNNQTIVDIKTFLDPKQSKDIDYVITYINMYGRDKNHYATLILDKLSEVNPIITFKHRNLPFLWIYKIK